MPKVKRNLKPPPPYWVEKCKASGMTPGDITDKWENQMTRGQRHKCTSLPILRAKNLAAAQARLAAGATDRRTISIVEKGGYKMHTNEQEAKIAHKKSIGEYMERRSEDTYRCRQLISIGCTVDGCILSRECDTGNARLLICLFHQISNDQPSSRSWMKTSIKSIGLEATMQQTSTMCLWHRFIRLRLFMNVKPAVDVKSKYHQKLSMLKQTTGCQHPLHAIMPYASLVPNSIDDPLMYAFLDVSHVVRGEALTSWKRTRTHMSALESGKAVVHCKFCHQLYTLCEYSRLYTSFGTSQQFNILLRYYPSFVQHFDESTSGYDWSKSRSVMCSNIQASRLRFELSSDDE